MGLERDLAGLPILHPPETWDIWNQDDPVMVTAFQRAEAIVRNVRRDATEGLVLPGGWTFELLTSGGRRQFDTNAIIERYDTRMAMSVMADFLLLGHQGVGSFALSADKTDLFSVALDSYLDIICEVFNSQGIPRLIGMNAEHFAGITEYPTLTHSSADAPNLKDLSAYIKELTGCGVIMPDEALEDFVRETGNLPERLEAQQFDRDARRQQQRDQKEKQTGGDIDAEEIEEEDAEDAKQAERAKKRLER